MASTSTSTDDEHRNASEQIASSPPTNAFQEFVPSSSAAYSTSKTGKKLPYDVFINHRGPDVKHTLAATLYNTLSVMGLRVFLDKEELQLGDYLPKELQDAMQSASLHIAIFSNKYAESPWCLAELAYMLKTGTPIIPIFYHLQPSDIRHDNGLYAEALSRHKKKGRYSSGKVEEWKDAISRVSYNIGDIINNEKIYNLGAWRIVSVGVGAVGCFPFQRSQKRKIGDCVEEENDHDWISSALSHTCILAWLYRN